MITQAYISKSVADFPFRTAYGLTEYVDSALPCAFFGCYNEDDICTILDHKGFAVIVWCGQDSKDFNYWKLFNKPNIKHVSGKSVAAYINNNTSAKCRLIKPKSLEVVTPKVRPLGNKIYVYLPRGGEAYHNRVLVKSLKTDYELLIGDGSYTQEEWRSGKADHIYSQCFIGLALSEYAGGGTTIVELGMRGIRCVTNVMDLPNVINWEAPRDVENAIKKEARFIGKIRTEVQSAMLDRMDNDNEFLNIEFYGNL